MTATPSPTAVPTGAGVVALSTGDVRVPVYPRLGPAAPRAADQPYQPPAGTADLRAQIAGHAVRRHGCAVSAGDVVVTPGARIAILAALMAVLRRGRRGVLLPTPHWSSYPWLIETAGGVPVRMPARPGEAGLDPGALDAAADDGTAVVVVNSPRNPDGAVAGPEVLREVLEWAAARDVVVLADEVYRGVPAATPACSMLDLPAWPTGGCIVVDGLTKSHALAGLRIGWAIADARWAAAMTAVCSHLIGSTCVAAQEIAAAALAGGDRVCDELREALRRNLDTTLAALASVPGVACARPAGGIFVFPDLTGWLASPAGEPARADLTGWLRERHGVAVVDGAAFGAPGHIRVSFALPPDHLADGLRRLCAALTGVPAGDAR